MVLVQAGDLFTPGGVARLAALEGALREVPGVSRVLGPASVERGVASRFGPTRERVLPPDAPAEELARRAAWARGDRLLAWYLSPGRPGPSLFLADLAPSAAGRTTAGRPSCARPRRRWTATIVPARS